MIGLFKSHFSIGKSILRIDSPGGSQYGADNIIDMAKEAGMDQIILVEDSLIGFLHSNKVAKEAGINLIFGLRIDCVLSKNQDEFPGKIIVFAKNGNGCKLLNKISTKANFGDDSSITISDLKSIWSNENLKLAIPFYDSFLYNNCMFFSNCIMDFSFTEPTFFIESNSLPFDELISSKVKEYALSNGYNTEQVQTIYYKNRSDIEAFQTYKCICNRKFGNKTLSRPNLDHFSSDEFSFESFLEKR